MKYNAFNHDFQSLHKGMENLKLVDADYSISVQASHLGDVTKSSQSTSLVVRIHAEAVGTLSLLAPTATAHGPLHTLGMLPC